MTYHVYVSLQGDDKIARFIMDDKTGALAPQGYTDIKGGPAPITVNPTITTLYVGQRVSKQLSSFAIDQMTGELELNGKVDVEGETCFISTDKTGNYLLSAYYQAGHCGVHPIAESGALGGTAIEWIATNSGAHCFQTDPSNRYAFLPHIADGSGGLSQLSPDKQAGINSIFLYKFDEITGKLTENSPARFNPTAKDGPRHYCFHPSKSIVYFSNEQGCSVTMYSLDSSTGLLDPKQTVTTLPDDFSGRSSCSQIQIHPSGKFLYVPNRGHNSIASFKIDQDTGELSPTGWMSAEPVPRAFTIDPTGQFMYVAGLETGNVTCFRIDQESGNLGEEETYKVGTTPMWIRIIGID